MKGAIVLLLVLIAVGVGYLAFGEYQRRQAVEDFAERVSDPGRWVTDKWIERAEMQCDRVTDLETVTTAAGVLRPEQFTCYSSRTGSWTVSVVACAEDLDKVANGYPDEDGQVFQPLSAACLEVRKQEL